MSKRRGRTARIRRRKTINSIAEKSRDHAGGYRNLLRWLKKKFDFNTKLLKTSWFPKTGRGLAARKNIKAGETIISIPKRAMIGVKRAFEDSEILQFIANRHRAGESRKITGLQALCIFLIEEKRKLFSSISWMKNGEWAPYLAVLPREFTHFLYWDEKTLTLLPLFLYTRASSVLEDVKRQWVSVNELILASYQNNFGLNDGSFSPLFDGISWEEYRWSWCCVNTRCVYSDHETPLLRCLLPTAADNYYLVPFLDLFNHSSDAKVKATFNCSNDHFEITIYKACRSHDQVFIHYGSHSSAKLLLEYGFVSSSEINKNDSVSLSWEDLILPYNMCKKEDSAILDYMQKRSLHTNWCFGYDGPSWSLVFSILILELFELGYFGHGHGLHIRRVEIHQIYYHKLKFNVQKSLKSLVAAKKKLISEKIKNCGNWLNCCASDIEKTYINIVMEYWLIAENVVCCSLEKVSLIDELPDCDLICLKNKITQ